MADTYAKDVTGHAVKLSPGQTEDIYGLGGGGTGTAEPVSKDYALELAQAEHDKALAEKSGQGMATLAGAVSGSSFGFGPALHIALKDLQGEEEGQLARHMWAGQRQMTGYQIGQLGGILAGTKGIGGATKGARALFGLEAATAEARGLLGSIGIGAAKLGAQGGGEGALMGLGSAVEDAAIQNKPLAAEAVLARMGDGAILGGGIGAAVGGAGGAMRWAAPKIKDVIGSAIARSVGNPETAYLRELGASSGTVRRIVESVEGGTGQFLKDADQMAQEQGLKLSSDPVKLRAVARENISKFTEIESATAKEFDKAATGASPSWGSFTRKVHEEIVAPEVLKPGGADIGQKVSTWIDRMAPQEAGGFKTWVDGRSNIVAASKSLPEGLGQRVLALYDAETRSAMLGAEAVDPTLKGATGRYTAAIAGKRVATELEGLMEERAAKPSSSPIKPWDVSAMASAAISGHPVAGVAYAMGRAGFRGLSERMGPAVAEAVWKMSAGANAAGAVAQSKTIIEKAINGYLNGRDALAVGAGKYAVSRPKLTRETYDKEIQDAYARLQKGREERLKDYLQASGSLGLAQAMVQKSDTAINYVNKNIPAAKGKNGTGAGSLRPMPVPKGLDFNEHLYMLKHGVVKNPYSIFSELENGRLSKDSVDALKQNWPEHYQLVVTEAQDQIAQRKESGKPLPMEKITQLSILLDSPLDATLSKPWIDQVQAAINMPDEQGNGGKPSPPPAMQMIEPFMTPTEKVA